MGAESGTSAAWSEYCAGVRGGLMPTEIFSVCALPHSCAADADFHVSLFVSPQADAGRAPRRAADVLAVPALGRDVVKDEVTVELFDQAGPIEATPLLGAVKPTVWDSAFPPDTPVKGRPVPDWQQRRWRTFDARTVHDFGKAVHLATMYPSPTAPPAPDDHPARRPARRDLAGSTTEPSTWRRSSRRRVYDESLMTADFDRIVESAESPAVIEPGDRGPAAVAAGGWRWSCTARAASTSGPSRPAAYRDAAARPSGQPAAAAARARVPRALRDGGRPPDAAAHGSGW